MKKVKLMVEIEFEFKIGESVEIVNPRTPNIKQGAIAIILGRKELPKSCRGIDYDIEYKIKHELGIGHYYQADLNKVKVGKVEVVK